MSREVVRPFLISKDEEGQFRLTVRRTRYNSQNYPIVDSVLQNEVFPTAASAKTFARDNFRAEPGQFATK